MEAAINSWSKIAEYTGLSEYEAKVYLSLIEQGVVGARKLSMTCEVPRTKVYGTLKKLIDLGLIIEMPGKPKSFTAIAPDTSLRSNLNTVKKKAKEFEIMVRSLSETYRRKQRGVEPKKANIWIIYGRRKIFNKIKELLSNAKKSADIVTNDCGVVLLFKATHKILDRLKEEGVKINLLSPMDPNRTLARELSYVCEVRNGDFKYPIFYVSVDQQRFVLSRMDSNNFELDSDCDMGIYSEETSLLSLISLLLKLEGLPLANDEIIVKL